MALLLFFEVMEKEPSIIDLWIVFLFIGVVGFILSCWKRPLGFLAILATLVAFGALAIEFHDPDINGGIWTESPLYLPQFYFAGLISIMLPVFGMSFCPRKTRQELP